MGDTLQDKIAPLIREQWYHLAGKLNSVRLSNEKDVVIWSWSHNKKYNVKLVYQHPTKDDNGSAYKEIWKAKNPLENKDLYVVSSSKAILTKDNMVGKNWKGDPGCYFCGGLKNIDHLLFSCPIAKVVWGVVTICFGQRVKPSS